MDNNVKSLPVRRRLRLSGAVFQEVVGLAARRKQLRDACQHLRDYADAMEDLICAEIDVEDFSRYVRKGEAAWEPELARALRQYDRAAVNVAAARERMPATWAQLMPSTTPRDPEAA